jgi:hypothetical protein
MNYSYILKNPEYSEKIKDTVCCAESAYLADIFNKLNSLNSSMQGRKEHLISASDKMKKKSKAVPLHAMEAHGGRGGVAPTHS